MFNILILFSFLATLVSAINVLKPIPDPYDLFPHLIKPRDVSDFSIFNPKSIHSFFWGDRSSASSAYIANFTLLAPGDHEDIIALKDMTDRLKSVKCDNATNTITIELLSQECFEHVANVWEWVNKHSENTFTMVTEAGQCDSDDIRNPYFVTAANFKEDGWEVTFDARRQTWIEVAHSFRLRTSRVTHEGTQGQNGTDGDSGVDRTHDDEMDKLLSEAQALQKELTSSGNRTDAKHMERLMEAKKTFTETFDATAKKGLDTLQRLVDRYGTKIKQIVDDATSNYADLKARATQKDAEATSTTDAWSLYEQALELEEQAIEIIEGAIVAIYGAIGETPPSTSLVVRSTLEKRFDFFGWLWKGIKKVGETIINGVANLLGANKPMTLDLESHWTPEIFDADRDDGMFGMDLTVGAELETGGKIVAEFEVDVDFDEASKVQVHVNPEDVFGSLTLNLSASGTLEKPQQWEPAHFDVPIPHAAFEIPFLIKLGPFFSLGLRTALTELTGNATLGIGTKATISDDAIISIDMLNAHNNKVSGWTPQFESIGPDFSATLEGEVAAWFSMALKFEASILGGRIGARAELEAQAPRFDARFNVSTGVNGICNSTAAMDGIAFEADVGVNLNLNAGLIGIPGKIVNGGAPLVKVDLLDLSWPLFSTCKAIGEESTPKTVIPTITAGSGYNATSTAGWGYNATAISYSNSTTAVSSPSKGTGIPPYATKAYASAPQYGNNTAQTPSPTYSPEGYSDNLSSPTPIQMQNLSTGADTTCVQPTHIWSSESVCMTKAMTVVECGPSISVVAIGPTVTVVHTIIQHGPTVTVTQTA